MAEDPSSSFEAELHALAAPLHDRLASLDAELAELTERVETLRAQRTQLRTALRAVDPTFEAERRPGPKKTKGKGYPGASETALAKAEQLLRKYATSNGGGTYTSTGLPVEHPDWPFSSSYTNVLLTTLHKRGVLRLDHLGGTTGKQKHFVLV